MPDPNNALETVLRQIREVAGVNLDKRQMTLIRAYVINYGNTIARLQDAWSYGSGPNTLSGNEDL